MSFRVDEARARGYTVPGDADAALARLMFLNQLEIDKGLTRPQEDEQYGLRWALPLDAGRLPGDGRTQPHLYDWLRGLNEADRQVADHTLAQFVALVKSKLAAERFELQNSYDEFDSAKLMHRCDTLDDVIEWGYTALAEAR